MISGIKDAVSESILLKGLIGLMMLSFGVWGVGDFIGTGGLDPTIAVQVGPTEITTFEFQRRFDQELGRFREEIGTQAARNDSVKRSIVNSMIQDITQTATVSAAAQELGIVIPMQRMQSGLLKEPAFQNSAGTFDQSRFMEVLFQNKLSESQFLDMFASDLRRSTIISPIISNSRAPEFLVENLFAYRNETRVADTLLISIPSLTDEDLPSDEELEALYKQNIAAYTAPEYRKITVLILEAKHFHSADDVAEADVRVRYEETSDRYRTSTTRRISQLIFDTQQEADSVRSQLNASDDLTALAAKAGVPAPIDLGDLSPGAPVVSMMGEAYNLPIGEISQPVETDLGWHLFYVASATPEAMTPFEEVKDDIRQAMVQEGGIDAVYEASVDVEDAIAGGTPLKEIAEFVGGEIIEIAEMDRNGLDRRGLDVPKIFDRTNFINTAFSFPEGEASQLLDTPSRSGYYVLQIDAVMPPAPRPLEEVRRAVVTLWEKQTRAAKAQALAAELESSIGPSSKFSEIAANHANVTYAPLGPVTRFGEGLEVDHIVDSKLISPAVLGKLFSTHSGNVVSAPVADGFVIARLKQTNIPNSEGRLASSHLQLKTTVQNTMREDIADQVVKAFAARYPAEINNEVIDQMISLR